MTALLVAAGGALGAVLRYLIDRRVQGRHASAFPWGTFAVNTSGSLLLGFLAGWALFGAAVPAVRIFAGVGLCGALTTFSTFGCETVQLLSAGARLYAVLNVFATVLAGLAAGAVGIAGAAALRAWHG